MKLITDKKISLLSFDLDGTLLNSYSEISKQTLETIHEVMGKGVKVTFATGRVPAMLEVYADMLGMKGPYVSANGALIINHGSNEILFEKRLPISELIKLSEYCNSYGLHFIIQTDRTLYYTADNTRVYMLDRYNKIACKNGRAPSKWVYIYKTTDIPTEQAIYKMIIGPVTTVLADKLKRYLDDCNSFIYTSSMAGFFEITAKGTNKGTGLKRVVQYYDIPMDEVCAFGDYDNDISAFQEAGISIAMENASLNLKEVAMYHTTSNDEDGIVKAIRAMKDCL